MDLIDVLFNKKNPFKPISVSGGTTNGRVKLAVHNEPTLRLPQSDLRILEDDVDDMRHQLNKDLKYTDNADVDSCPLDDMECIYKKYKFDKRPVSATQLPIYDSKRKILSKIAKYPTIVIEGSTGCGKSTQVS